MIKYKNIAFIPARGGSKSIKLKNIKLLNGRPLIYWAIDAAVKCEMIDVVFVATDNEQIAQSVLNYGNDKVKLSPRSPETATDTATTESAMLEFANNNDFDNIILLQATSPLIDAEFISMGLNLVQSENYDSIISVVRQKRFIWEMDNNLILPKNYNPQNRPMRQNFDGYFVENGSFYITKRENLLNSKCRISGKIGYVEMHENSYYEIDEPTDFVIVENLMLSNKQKKFNFNNIKAFFTDCDGVLTDGGMYYTNTGDELKKFNAKDGMGFGLLHKNNIITGIITGEKNKIIIDRAKKLNVDELHMAVHDKLYVINNIKQKYNLDYSQIAYIGDDINDISVLKAVGFSAAVADANEAVKKISMYITKANGGYGAVREVIDLILETRFNY